MSPTLAAYWHPIAASQDVEDQPKRFRLLDQPIVAFRTETGVSAFNDLCIHRGAALSLGWVEDGRITCAYHGWQYDREGACVRIPSLPEGSTIPGKARAVAYHAVEKYGLVWVAMEDPVAPVPSWPESEWDDPAWRIFRAFHFVWKTSAGRAIENFMDVSHFPFVHAGLLGETDRTVVEPYGLEELDNGVTYMIEAVEPNEVHHAPEEKVRRRYTLSGPFAIHVKKSVESSDQQTVVSMITSPTSEKTTDVFVFIARNYDLDPEHDEAFAKFTGEVMMQDQKIVESQRPEQIPLSLREELHLKVPDAAGIAYRRFLGSIANVGVHMP